MIDAAAIVVIALFSVRNEKRPPDAAEIGPFRLKPFQPPPAPAKAIVAARRRRVRGL